jgi:hypothetical protein
MTSFGIYVLFVFPLAVVVSWRLAPQLARRGFES